MKKLVTILIIQIFACTVCFSQQEKIDSVKKVLSTAKDTQRINCLNTLSRNYRDLNSDTSLLFALTALHEARQLQYTPGIAEALFDIGRAKMDKGKVDTALHIFLKAIELFKKYNNIDTLGSAYENLAELIKNFSEAIAVHNKAIDCFKEAKDSGRLGWALTMMGLDYKYMGNYEKAFELFNQSMQIGKAIHDHARVLYSYSNLGFLFQEIDDYPTAIDYYYNQPKEYAKKNKIFAGVYDDKVGECYCAMHNDDSALYNFKRYIGADTSLSLEDQLKHISKNKDFRFWVWGEIYMIEKQYDNALAVLLPQFKNSESEGGNEDQAKMLSLIVQSYLAKNDYENALEYSKKLFALAQNAESRLYKKNAAEFLWKIYDHQKITDSAYKYFTQYSAMKDSVSSYRFLSRLTAFKQAAENTRKDLAYQQQLQQEAFTKKILAISIILILLISFFVFRFILLKRKAEAHQHKILQNELEIQKLEGEKTKAELQKEKAELEMQALRAQMNPHFIFNSLNSINRFILQNNKAEASEYLTKFSKLVRMILQNSQASLITLESELESLSLYLEMEALRFNYYFTYKISLSKDLDVEVLKVPPLIIQPYVENAIWHGLMHKEEKGELNIEVSSKIDHLYFRITDNGIGRKQAAALASKSATKHKSMGLRITAQRISMMQKVNGQEVPVSIVDLTYPDGSAAGTEVTIKMPEIYD